MPILALLFFPVTMGALAAHHDCPRRRLEQVVPYGLCPCHPTHHSVLVINQSLLLAFSWPINLLFACRNPRVPGATACPRDTLFTRHPLTMIARAAALSRWSLRSAATSTVRLK